jgi:hypothetical protein
MSSTLDRRRPIWTVAEETMDESRLWRMVPGANIIGGGTRKSVMDSGCGRAGLIMGDGVYVVGGRSGMDCIDDVAVRVGGKMEYGVSGSSTSWTMRSPFGVMIRVGDDVILWSGLGEGFGDGLGDGSDCIELLVVEYESRREEVES